MSSSTKVIHQWLLIGGLVLLTWLTGLVAKKHRGSEVVGRSIPELLTHALGPDEIGPEGAVVYVYDILDCQYPHAMFARLDDWQQRSIIRVLALQVSSDPRAARTAQAPDGLSSHVARGVIEPLPAAAVAEALGHRSTPFGVVLDAGGRVAGSFPGDLQVPDDWLYSVQRRPGYEERLPTPGPG
jgi:hypothetical protein